VNFAKAHARVNGSRIAAAGYCFGGSAVLQFAKHGGAAAAAVAAVVSFHGGLGGVVKPLAKDTQYCPTRVAVHNGAKDAQIPASDIAKLETTLARSKTVWEVSTYAFAGHGFTHPKDGTDHFQFEKAAEQRSWAHMGAFVSAAWDGQAAGKLNVSQCGRVPPPVVVKPVVVKPTGGGTCADNNAKVKALAGAYGMNKCTKELCTGTYAAQMKPFCMKTCGHCTVKDTCADNNAKVKELAGAYGMNKCTKELCTGTYAAQMKPFCMKTCGHCSSPSAPTASPTASPTAKSNSSVQTSVVVAGSFALTVANASAFIADADVKLALAGGIAEQAGVDVSLVVVTLSLGARRLSQIDVRRLGAHSMKTVNVAYTITVTQAASAALQTKMAAVTKSALTTTMNAKLAAKNKANFVVTVSSVTAPTVTAVTTTVAAANSDFASDAVQRTPILSLALVAACMSLVR